MTLPSRLIQLIILGFILRLMFAFFADHVYYPDEIYQASEIGHQLVYGYAMIPWDIAYGLRSFMLPGLTAIPQLIQQFLPIPLFPPHLLDKLFFICFSLYYNIKRTRIMKPFPSPLVLILIFFSSSI